MKAIYSLILLVSAFFICSCGGEKRDPMMSQLIGHTYWEIRDIVFENAAGEGMEWHGEALDGSAVEDLSLSFEGSCAQENCGQGVYIKNQASGEVEAVLQIFHGVEDIFPHFTRKVSIPTGEQLHVGCRQFCYEGGNISLSYKVLGAKVISK